MTHAQLPMVQLKPHMIRGKGEIHKHLPDFARITRHGNWALHISSYSGIHHHFLLDKPILWPYLLGRHQLFVKDKGGTKHLATSAVPCSQETMAPG
jgi:hypothetical protein